MNEGLLPVRFEPSAQVVHVAPGCSILQAVQRTGLPLSTACDGDFLCGFCRVQVTEGFENLEPAEAKERQVLAAMGAGPFERLACQALLRGPATITADYW